MTARHAGSDILTESIRGIDVERGAAGELNRVFDFKLMEFASTLSTIMYWLCRALATPSGGSMILFQLDATSSAVSGEPSCHLTPSRMLKV